MSKLEVDYQVPANFFLKMDELMCDHHKILLNKERLRRMSTTPRYCTMYSVILK